MKDQNDRMEHLACRYIDGLGGDEERLEMESLLNDSSEARKTFVRLMKLHASLKTTLYRSSHSKEDSLAQQEAEEGSLSKRVKLSVDLKKTRWMSPLWMNLAAILLLMIGGGIFYHSGSLNPVVDKNIGASVISSVAKGRLFRGAVWSPLRQGMSIQAGDIVETGERGGLEIKYKKESTKVILGEKTRVEFNGATQSKQIRLEYGRLNASVAKQAVGEYMKIMTAQAEIKVIGTRFLCDVSDDRLKNESPFTRLNVFEGLVQLTQLSDGQSIGVAGGQYAVVVGDTPLVTSDISKDEMNGFFESSAMDQSMVRVNTDFDGEILFEDHFENGLENWEVIVEGKSDVLRVQSSNLDKYIEIDEEIEIRGKTFLDCLVIRPDRPLWRNEPERFLGIRSKKTIQAKSFVVEAYMSLSREGPSITPMTGIDSLENDYSNVVQYGHPRRDFTLYRWEFRPVEESGEEGVYFCRFFYWGRLFMSCRVRPLSKKIALYFNTKDRRAKGYVDRVSVRELLEKQ